MIAQKNMAFLLETKEPKTAANIGGKFLKFPTDVTVKFRVLPSAYTLRTGFCSISGWVYWTDENKPVRLRGSADEKPTNLPNIRKGEDGKPEQPKFFWAFVVWDYSDNIVKICEVAKATIRDGMRGYFEDDDYGSPENYDLKITRTGKTFNDTKYTVIAAPPKSFEIQEVLEEAKLINLEALFCGLNPFDETLDNFIDGNEIATINDLVLQLAITKEDGDRILNEFGYNTSDLMQIKKVHYQAILDRLANIQTVF